MDRRKLQAKVKSLTELAAQQKRTLETFKLDQYGIKNAEGRYRATLQDLEIAKKQLAEHKF